MSDRSPRRRAAGLVLGLLIAIVITGVTTALLLTRDGATTARVDPVVLLPVGGAVDAGPAPTELLELATCDRPAPTVAEATRRTAGGVTVRMLRVDDQALVDELATVFERGCGVVGDDVSAELLPTRSPARAARGLRDPQRPGRIAVAAVLSDSAFLIVVDETDATDSSAARAVLIETLARLGVLLPETALR